VGKTQGRSLSAFRTSRRLARDGCAGELGERQIGVGGVIRRELEIVARVFDNGAINNHFIACLKVDQQRHV